MEYISIATTTHQQLKMYSNRMAISLFRWNNLNILTLRSHWSGPPLFSISMIAAPMNRVYGKICRLTIQWLIKNFHLFRRMCACALPLWHCSDAIVFVVCWWNGVVGYLARSLSARMHLAWWVFVELVASLNDYLASIRDRTAGRRLARWHFLLFRHTSRPCHSMEIIFRVRWSDVKITTSTANAMAVKNFNVHFVDCVRCVMCVCVQTYWNNRVRTVSGCMRCDIAISFIAIRQFSLPSGHDWLCVRVLNFHFFSLPWSAVVIVPINSMIVLFAAAASAAKMHSIFMFQTWSIMRRSVWCVPVHASVSVSTLNTIPFSCASPLRRSDNGSLSTSLHRTYLPPEQGVFFFLSFPSSTFNVLRCSLRSTFVIPFSVNRIEFLHSFV